MLGGQLAKAMVGKLRQNQSLQDAHTLAKIAET